VDELISEVSYLGEFRDAWVSEGHRSLTFRVTLRPRTATFTSGSNAAVRTGVLDALHHAHGAHLR
jgi:phenylalanyl-tRNA synthetase beta chain